MEIETIMQPDVQRSIQVQTFLKRQNILTTLLT